MSVYKCTQEAENDVTGYSHASKLLGIAKTNSHSTLFDGKFSSLWTNQPACHSPFDSKHVQGSARSTEVPKFLD